MTRAPTTMKYRYMMTTTTVAFIAVVVTAGAWMGVARGAAGQPGLIVTLLGGVFSTVFVWLLIIRLRRFLARPENRLLELGLLAVNFSILLVAFAWVHHEIGLMDVSGPVPVATNDFWDALYFSIVTSTTLGYGDFLPLRPGRPVAALQAVVGYMILGILVSAGFQILAPDEDTVREQEREQDEEARGAGQEPAR